MDFHDSYMIVSKLCESIFVTKKVATNGYGVIAGKVTIWVDFVDAVLSFSVSKKYSKNRIIDFP